MKKEGYLYPDHTPAPLKVMENHDHNSFYANALSKTIYVQLHQQTKCN